MATTTRTRSRGSGDASPAAHARVASSTPGRLRVRLHPQHRQAPLIERVHADLGDRPGIQQVESNPATGSVVMRYDPQLHTGADMLAMLRDIGIIVADIAHAGEEGLAEVEGEVEEIDEVTTGDPTETVHTGEMGVVGPLDHSAAATSVVGAVDDLNTRVSRYTGGFVDLKLLFPLGLGALGVFKVLRDGLQLAEVPGYVLLWYAFDSFHKFHRPHVVHVSHPAPVPPAAEGTAAPQADADHTAE